MRRVAPAVRAPSSRSSLPRPQAPSRSIGTAATVASLPSKPISLLTKSTPTYLPTFSSFPIARSVPSALPPKTAAIFDLPSAARSPFNVRIPMQSTEVPALVDADLIKSFELISTKRRRVKKMAKHQYRKRLKKTRLEMRRLAKS